MRKIIFNSSLPRAGSTLMQNILAQNPRFYASPTSGLIELLYTARQTYTSADEFKLKGENFYDKAWLSFCKSGVEGFYEGLTDKPVCIDKSRSWIHYYDWLSKFYPNPKIIVCIRDLRSILSSMEKMNRNNAHLHYNGDVPIKMNFITVGQRVDHWMSSFPVGLAVNRLKNAIQKKNDEYFHFVKFEHLVEDPINVMKRLYEYIEEPYFEHNFDTIEQKVSENDDIHGIYGDHKIRNKLEPVTLDWDDTLGVDVSNAIVNFNKWFYDKFYR